MSFRDDLQADLDIFVESEEFAQFVTLDGIYLRAQVDSSTAQKSGNASLNFDALHGDFLTLYFKTADYCGKKQRLPVHGEQIWMNEKRYDVESCEDQLGITKLTLAAYRQNTLRPRPFRGVSPYEN
ncbi:MAG: hypothetical protein IJ774_05435 [Selenomonadaceae bacterium]|nr:hypothetical protein [Selenomonadaceae bacterium]MBR1805817.1 hypothetical protein [Selenomonadaceae bacterium]